MWGFPEIGVPFGNSANVAKDSSSVGSTILESQGAGNKQLLGKVPFPVLHKLT